MTEVRARQAARRDVSGPPRLRPPRGGGAHRELRDRGVRGPSPDGEGDGGGQGRRAPRQEPRRGEGGTAHGREDLDPRREREREGLRLSEREPAGPRGRPRPGLPPTPAQSDRRGGDAASGDRPGRSRSSRLRSASAFSSPPKRSASPPSQSHVMVTITAPSVPQVLSYDPNQAV